MLCREACSTLPTRLPVCRAEESTHPLVRHTHPDQESFPRCLPAVQTIPAPSALRDFYLIKQVNTKTTPKQQQQQQNSYLLEKSHTKNKNKGEHLPPGPGGQQEAAKAASAISSRLALPLPLQQAAKPSSRPGFGYGRVLLPGGEKAEGGHREPRVCLMKEQMALGTRLNKQFLIHLPPNL